MSGRRLYRSENGVLGGVCAGIAEFFDIDASLVRIVFLALFFMSFGAPVMVYVVLWVILPLRPTDYAAYVDVTPQSAQCAGSRSHAAGSEQDVPPATDYIPTHNIPYSGIPDPQEPDRPAKSAGKPSRALTIIGIVLVVVGVGTIVARLIGNASWWTCWPLFIIAWGVVVMLATPKEDKSLAVTMIDGAVIIAVGAVLLFCSIGRLSWAVVASIALQWPFFVIAAGVSVVAVALKSSKLHVVAGVAAICALLLGLCNYQFDTDMMLGQLPAGGKASAQVSGSVARQQTVVADLDGVDSPSLSVNAGGANFSIVSGAGTEAVLLANGVARSSMTYKTSKDRENISLDVGGFGRPSASMLILPQGVAWDTVDIDGGASRLDLDFSDIEVRDLELEAGASSVRLVLGESAEGGSTADLEAGASHLVLVIPSNVGARVTITNVGDVNVGDGFAPGTALGRHSLEVYAPDSDGGSVWQVDIDGGIASVDLVRGEAA